MNFFWILLGIINFCSALFFAYNFYKILRYWKTHKIPTLPETRLFHIISFPTAVFFYFVMMVTLIVFSLFSFSLLVP